MASGINSLTVFISFFYSMIEIKSLKKKQKMNANILIVFIRNIYSEHLSS